MAIKINKGLSPFWYTPASQKVKGENGNLVDAEGAARVRLRPLTGEEQNVAGEGMGHDPERGTISLSGKTVSYILRQSLLEWENVEGEDGPLKCIPENHRWLPGRDRADIALHIYVESVLSEDQSKN